MRLASFCAPKHVSLWWTDAVDYDIGVSSTNRCCSIAVLCDARGHGDQISVSGIFFEAGADILHTEHGHRKCFASCAAFWRDGPTVCLSSRVVVQCCEASEITLRAAGRYSVS